MSKERELLKRLAEKDMVQYYYGSLVNEIQELLAQTEQEPLTPRQGLAEYKRGYARAELDLKRKPLSDEEVYSIGNKYAFHAAVREIERIHGIGGGE